MHHLKSTQAILAITLGAGLLLLSACGKKETSDGTPKHDARDDAKAFYAAHPEFFHQKTLADIPTDLKWDDGMDLPDLGSPEAKKGGMMSFWVQDFPRTLRTVGPDSNGSFRPWILDDNAIPYATRHPNDTSLTQEGFRHYPGIADRWALDKANKTVYVHINPAAKWNDGVPITVDDVFFNFFFYRSTNIKAPWYNNFYSTKYAGVTRFDENTFALHFPELRPDIYSLALGTTPVPSHYYTEFGEDFPERYQWKFAPSTGPYTVRPEDIDKGRSITLTRVKDWWAKDQKYYSHRFNPDRIRLSVIRDTAKAFESFRKGDIDWFSLSLAEYWYDKLPDSADEVKNGYIQKIKFFNDVPRPTYGLWMNESIPLLNNRDIRVGLQYAMNWELVIEKFSRRDWTRMQTSADGYGEFTHPTLRSRTYSIENAMASFAKAGFTQRGPDGILTNKDGTRLSFQVSTGYENLKDVLTILREEALKAGVDLRVEVLDSTAAWKKVQEKKHEIQFSAFNVGPEMFPRYWETYHSANAYDKAFLDDGSVNPDRVPKTQTNNLQVIAYPELDRMIETYDKSESLEEMKQLAFKMEEFMDEDASFSPGFNIPFIRTGAWRWLRMPEDGNVKIATSFSEHSLYWIDEDVKNETKAAMKESKALSPMIKVYDQYKLD
jgi:microcin C transport system substrate-binding protein|uniref:extracellular solute-binding protein n=2 Tax=Cephaloticoccus sp. TaxID=1985742 RepID=UPI00404B906C